MAKELCLTPGGLGSVHKHVRQKAHTQESAETIVSRNTSGEGSNVNVLQIAVNKVGAVRNRGYAHQAGTYACGGRRQGG